MKPPAISLDQVRSCDWLLTVEIPPSYQDENGHMNVRYYLSVFDDAGYPLVASLGMTPEFHKEHGTGGFDLEHHIHFLREVHVGDRVAVYARLVGVSSKRIHYLMFMVNETRDTLAAIFECVNSFADLRVRRTAPYPPELAAAIAEMLARHQALGWDPPVCGVMSAGA